MVWQGGEESVGSIVSWLEGEEGDTGHEAGSSDWGRAHPSQVPSSLPSQPKYPSFLRPTRVLGTIGLGGSSPLPPSAHPLPLPLSYPPP